LPNNPNLFQNGKKHMVFLLMLEIHFTVRSNSNKQMKAMKLVNVAKKATIFQLECKTSWTQSFQANENSIEAVNYIKKVVNSNNFEL
jgi:metal-dependent amidase/aminoacylase/carboxypeptidase family protein